MHPSSFPSARRVRALLVGSLLFLPLAVAQFPDVPAGHWAEGAVARMIQLGVITGFPDGTFQGEQGVTRYQMSLLLSRMWDSWSKEQLGDVWTELVGVNTRLDALQRAQGELELLAGELREGGDRALAAVEERLQSLEALLEGQGDFVDRAAFQDFERVYLERLRALEQDLAALTISPSTEEAELHALSLELKSLRAGLTTVRERLDASNEDVGELRTQVAGLQRTSDVLGSDLQALGANLQTLQAAAPAVPAVAASLTLTTGFTGRRWNGGVGIDLGGSSGSLQASLGDGGLEARFSGYLLPAVALQGRLDTATALGMVGLETSLGGLDLGLLAGVDDALAGTLYASHDGAKASAVVPNLDLVAAASLGEGQGQPRFSVQLRGSYRFSGDGFYLAPSFAYRRVTALEPYSLLAPGLEAAVRLGGAATLAVAAQYVFATGTAAQPLSRSFPEASLDLTFDSGAFVGVILEGGAPDLTALPTFEDFNPARAQDLFVGVKVGYTVRFE